MAAEQSIRDGNQVTALLVQNASATTETLAVQGDASTHSLKVYIAGSSAGASSENIAQVNGQSVNVGTGAAGTGTLRVTTSTDSTIGTVTTLSTLTGGGVASGATDSGNPIKIGGVYNTTPPTLTNAQRGDAQMDTRANMSVTLGTLISGEDQTNNVMKVEEQFTGAQCTGDTQVKAASGFLHAVTISCNDSAPTAGTIIIYDNTAESGAQVFNFSVTTTYFNPFTVMFNRVMSTGIYCGFTTTGDVNVQINYR